MEKSIIRYNMKEDKEDRIHFLYPFHTILDRLTSFCFTLSFLPTLKRKKEINWCSRKYIYDILEYQRNIHYLCLTKYGFSIQSDIFNIVISIQ